MASRAPIVGPSSDILTMPSFNVPVSPLVEHPSETQLLRERATAILWVKSQMARHSIAVDDLVAAGCFGRSTQTANPQGASPFRYKDAEGHTWDGSGNLPDWLQRAVNAGQSVDHFRIS